MLDNVLSYLCVPGLWSVLPTTQTESKGHTWLIHIPTPRIFAAYTRGQRNLSMCSGVLCFKIALSDILKTQLKRVETLILFNGLWKGCSYFVLMNNKNEMKVKHIDQNGKASIFITKHFLKANGWLPTTDPSLSCHLLIKRWHDRYLNPSLQSVTIFSLGHRNKIT